MFQRIIKRIDHMRFWSDQDDIFDFLRLGINLYNIASERISRIYFASDKKLSILDSHLNDLIIDG